MHCNSAVLVSLCLALCACGASTSNGPGNAPAGGVSVMSSGMASGQAAITVEVIQPTSGDSLQTLETAGSLFAWQEVPIGAEVSGYRIAEVLVDVGDSVSKGQVLARLDTTLLRDALNQAQAAVTVAAANAQQADASARRGNALQQPGVISKQDAEQLNTNAATAAAQLVNAQAQLQSAQQRLEYTNIRASDAGVISARAATPGQIANAGVTLFSLIRDNRIEWRAEVPAADLTKLRRGMVARIKRADGTLANGTVRTLSPGLDPSTQRGTAYVDLRLENQLRPGMYVTGSIELARTRTLQVPLAAVTVRDGFSYVFVLQPDNTVRQQRITAGRLTSDRVEVLEGIGADDKIVSSGVGLLRDGEQVAIASASAPVEQPAAAAANTTP